MREPETHYRMVSTQDLFWQYQHFYTPPTNSGLFYHNSLRRSIFNSRVSSWFSLLLCFIEIPVFNANSVDPDLMLHSATSDLGLHCLLVFLLGVSRLKWVEE